MVKHQGACSRAVERGLAADMGAMILIADIEHDERPPGIAGWHLDSPRAGARVEASGAQISGWVLGADAPVRTVEVRRDGYAVRHSLVGVERPDLVGPFPGVPWAGRAGFRTNLELFGSESRVALELNAIFPDGRRARLATLRGQRCWRRGDATDPAALVSVVVPCHNQAHYLDEAIESVLSQTYPHVEIVVVNDGSTDNTGEVAGQYPGVRCIHQEQAGLSAARNAGIRHTIGEFLVFLDADDRLLRNALRQGLDAFTSHPECAFVFGRYIHVDGEGVPLPTPFQKRVEGDVYEALLRTNVCGMPATGMYRRGAFEHVDSFDVSLDACSDYDLALRLASCLPVHDHGEVVVEYRRHARAMSNNHARMLPAVLAAHRRQRALAARRPAHRRAWTEGRRFWRRYYGDPLVQRLFEQSRERRWNDAARTVSAVLRHHPAALMRLSGGDPHWLK